MVEVQSLEFRLSKYTSEEEYFSLVFKIEIVF